MLRTLLIVMACGLMGQFFANPASAALIYEEDFESYDTPAFLSTQHSGWVNITPGSGDDFIEYGRVVDQGDDGQMYGMRRHNGHNNILRKDIAPLHDVEISSRILFDDSSSSRSAVWGLYARHGGDDGDSFVRARLRAARDTGSNAMWLNLFLETEEGIQTRHDRVLEVTGVDGRFRLEGTLELIVTGDQATASFNGESITMTLGETHQNAGYTGFHHGMDHEGDRTWGMYIDDIRVVPEPGSLSLLALGGLIMFRRGTRH